MFSAIENARLDPNLRDIHAALSEQVWLSADPKNTIENMPEPDTAESDALLDKTDEFILQAVKAGLKPEGKAPKKPKSTPSMYD